MNQEKRKKASKEQQSFLINYLEGDLSLARNQFSAVDGRESNLKKCQNLVNTLNGIGGSNKTGELWKKYWEDLRLRIKEKYIKHKRFQNKTGDNSDGPPELTELEKKVISIISLDAVEGDQETPELGACEIVARPIIKPTSHNEAKMQEPNIQETQKRSKRYVGESTAEEEEYFKISIQLKKRKIEILEEIAATKNKKLILLEKLSAQKINLQTEELNIRKRELVLKEQEFIALHGEYLIDDN